MSRQQFTPGKKSGSIKIMNYITLYNQLFPENPKNCVCIPDQYDKYTVGSDSPSIKESRQFWVSYLCRRNILGGTIQYGNGYLGQPIQINYLGRGEGQPGGSGAPPRNKF